MSTNNSDTWRPDGLPAHPAFDFLAPTALAFAGFGGWPALSDYQNLLSARPPVSNAAGTALRVIPQEQGGMHYELRIDDVGELLTRAHCWHDYFQILVWRCLPRSKAALSARHAAATRARIAARQPQRSPVENAGTLFDENGALIVTSDPTLIELARRYAWRELFCDHRAAWGRDIDCYVFGHALYEKLLAPYIGLTAHAVFVAVDATFWHLTTEQRRTHLDATLAALLHRPETLAGPKQLQPIPILGVPSWHPDNDDPRFYDNAGYFRPGRGHSKSASDV